MCFSDWWFAADEPEMWSIAWLESFVINVLSRGWVLLAKLAWEFLTNKWVYGELLWLDSLFRQYRNITKNIANFCLWFYFIYIIFRWLIDQWKESIANVIKNKILWILIAWVWIQISWFFTAAMVDVSTITLVAAWSLPAQVISSNEKVKWSYENSLADFFDAESQSIMYGRYMSLFNTDSKSGKFIKVSHFPLQQPVDQKAFFDSLVPSSDTVSWPLYSMWFAILDANKVTSIDSSKEDGSSLKWSMLNLIIMWWTTIVYALELFVLCVLAMMRIIYLWMFIVLSPFAIFLWCLQMAKDDKVLEWSFVKTLMKQIKLKSFFINIFKPTIIVIWIGLATIFAFLMKWVVIESADRPIDLWWIVINTKPMETNNNSEDEFFSSTMNGGIIKFTIWYVWKWLLDLIISIITVILVYVVINFAMKMWDGKDFVSEKLKKVQETAWWLVTSLPVMPVAGYDKEGIATTRYMSLGQVFWVDEDMKSNRSGWLLGAKIRKYQDKVNDEYSRQNQIINSWFAANQNIVEFKSADQQKVISAWRAVAAQWWLKILQAQLDEIKALGERKPEEGWLKKGYWYWMTLNPDSTITFWRTQFENWLSTVKESDIGDVGDKNTEIWKRMVKWWKDNEKERTLEKMFKENGNERDNVKAYAEFFGLDDGVDTWKELIEHDISRKK